MNRSKHPGRAPHRRRASGTDCTKNTTAYRITGSWNGRPDRPVVEPTSDRKAARRISRVMAAQGAYVIVEEHVARGRWRTLYEVDGPALLAEQQAAEQARRIAAEEAARAAADAERARRTAEQRRERELAVLARLMCRPPVPREACGRREVRHMTGAQR
ncbi:hypothetical protein [Streptomyces sp. BPTC-684]|uniref:hypothetical protein n=1 Tax=Streptomyces sp. BPTC-684 TaxID=3043734 RepID=UPI0024B14B83|nr:hypothetical protein [Streptomyces sp. BPTC-684]WHM36294.1 hypothetical protein QIY60_04690 [Streptomyces sp. BPTC-684]